MTVGESQDPYVFEQQESAERAAYLTNQLVAFNQQYASACQELLRVLVPG